MLYSDSYLALVGSVFCRKKGYYRQKKIASYIRYARVRSETALASVILISRLGRSGVSCRLD